MPHQSFFYLGEFYLNRKKGLHNITSYRNMMNLCETLIWTWPKKGRTNLLRKTGGIQRLGADVDHDVDHISARRRSWGRMEYLGRCSVLYNPGGFHIVMEVPRSLDGDVKNPNLTWMIYLFIGVALWLRKAPYKPYKIINPWTWVNLGEPWWTLHLCGVFCAFVPGPLISSSS